MHDESKQKADIERRKAPRFELSNSVRFLLATGEEGSGRLLDISECGVAIVTDASATVQEEIIVYVEGLGRFRGEIARAFQRGFCAKFKLSETEQLSIKQRIATAREGLPYFRLTERRSANRTSYNIETQVKLDDVAAWANCIILDMSKSGCLVKCDHTPQPGSKVIIGTLKGVVRRCHKGGFAVEFLRTPTHDPAIHEAMTKTAETADDLSTMRNEQTAASARL